MIIINKDLLDETRIEKTGEDAGGWPFVDIIGSKESAPTDPAPPISDTDATQRILINDTAVAMTSSTQPNTGNAQVPPAPPRRRTTGTAEKRAAAIAARKKKERITLISISAVAAVLLIAIIVIIISTVGSTADNGLILNNVYAAGVDVGGMTKDQAKAALHEATDDTYSVLDMTVQVLDTTITLTPMSTGVRLDVDAVVEAAYNFGRTGSRAERQQAQKLVQSSTYAIDLEQYLTLDKGYIQDQITKLGKQFSTTLTQTTYKIDGARPTQIPSAENIDLNKTYQTLSIQIGSAEYGLSTNRILEQIMDAYSANLFYVVGECSVVTPDELDCEALFAQFCSAPVDAVMDPDTFKITPEVYGYGFTLEHLKKTVAEADYGTTVTIPLTFVEPDITTKILSGDLFQDVLAAFQTTVSSDAAWNSNMDLACKALNDLIIKSGEEFSFNDVIGEPTKKNGYQSVNLYVGKAMTDMVGGGISQVATALYNCALMADLKVIERHTHSYSPSFVSTGLDAQVYYGSMDLRFTNTTENPIKIEAAVSNGFVQIRFIGTDTKNYTVDLSTTITNTKAPGTDYVKLTHDNPGNLKDGDVYAQGITGYDVNIYKLTYDTQTGRELGKELIATASYAKKNKVVVSIAAAPAPNPSASNASSETVQ